MICNNCRREITDNTLTKCPYCGSVNLIPKEIIENTSEEVVKEKDFTILIIVVLLIAVGSLVAFMVSSADNKNDYYFDESEQSSEAINEVIDTSEEKEYVAVSKTGQDGNATGAGVTRVVFDNQYLKQTILTSHDEVSYFIKLDNDNNKTRCTGEIKEIENRIETNYGVTAVNLCEIDLEFAYEIESIIAHIYNTYPSSRGKLTNVTIANVGDDANYMAAFMPMFTFVTSNTNSSYPLGIKTQIILNAKYFLNTSKLENTVTYGSATGYFPPNATRSSTVAHEFGHYLSYIGMMNYYKAEQLTFVRTNMSSTLLDVNKDFIAGDYSKMVIEQAYLNYQTNYGGTLSFDDFRGSISKYAVAKNAQGLYIYDETIAEAYHDIYLNGDNAKLASKLIIEALLTYL